MALPAATYAGLGGASAGALKLMASYGIVGWHGSALVASCIGMPLMMVLSQLGMHGGRGIAEQLDGTPSKDPKLHALARKAAAAVGVSPPHVYILPSREPNAFATSGLGGGDTTVAITEGLRQVLSDAELGAVLAHEMGHLKHRDVVRNMHVAAAAAGLGGVYQIGRILLDTSSGKRRKKRKSGDDEGESAAALGLGLMAAGAIAEGAAHLFRLAASRSAELKADRAAAEAFGAQTIINALKKIEAHGALQPADLRGNKKAKFFSHAMISDGPTGLEEATNSLWRFIRKVGSALRTHPTLQMRVKALEAAQQAGLVPASIRADSSWGW